MDSVSFEWVLGAVFVGVNAYRRYNTPVSNRESTTFQNFSLYFLFYLFSILIVYVVLGALFDSSPETVAQLYRLLTADVTTAKSITETATTQVDKVSELSAPMVSALFLSTLMPSLPWLSRYDRALLQFFWDRGHIPNHVQKMAAGMRRAPFNFSPQQNQQLRSVCQSLQVEHDALDMLSSASLDYHWARINVLLDSIDAWKDDDTGRVRRYMQEHKEELAQFSAMRDEINKEFTELRAEQLDPHALAKMERFLGKSISELFRNTTVFVAKAVCISELTQSGRASRISQLGFEGGGQGDDRLSARQLAQALLAILISFSLISVVQELGKPVEFRRFGNVGFLIYLMVFTYGASLIIALYMKSRVSLGYNELTRQRPWFSYLLVSVVTGLSWLFVSIGCRYIPNMLSDQMDSAANLDQVLKAISWSYPYALQSMALAVSLSLILDKHQSSDLAERLTLPRRMVDVAFAVGALSIASLVAYCWMEGQGLFEGYATRDEPFRGRTHFSWFIFKGAVVGAVVGWLVPMWFYLNRTRAPEQIAGRLITMNKKGLSEEIRTLSPNELVQAVGAVGALVATVDGNVSKSEVDVYMIICSHLAGLPNSDVETEDAQNEFNVCLAQLENEGLVLESRLENIAHLPLLSALIPYIASSIAFADGVYLEPEKEVVERVKLFQSSKESL